MRRRWPSQNLSDPYRRLWVLLLVPALLLLSASSDSDARKANKAYEEGDYEKAAELYREALETDPENPLLYFNLGNSLTHLGLPEQALQAFERARSLADDPSVQALADYNMGNLLAEEPNPAAAAEKFKQALQNNPQDPDARHNYELARKQQQEQEHQEQDPSPENEQEDEEGDQQQEQQQGGQPPPDEQENNGQSRQQQDMSMDEAQNILDALQQRERDLLESRRKDANEENQDYDRDW